MLGIVGIIAFLVVLGLSLVITRVATVALALTGLSKEVAQFQARSAFTGTGFTTTEAENIVNHPVRRRIVNWLMITRSAGLVTIVISLILSFAGSGAEADRLSRLLVLLGGIGLFWALSVSHFFMDCLNRAIEWALRRWTTVDVADYASLLNLSGPYRVTRIDVREGEWLANKKIRDTRLREEGVLVLGIDRFDNQYVGVPEAKTVIHAGDSLILYGRDNCLRELSRRRSNVDGDTAHRNAVQEQKEQLARQDVQERKTAEKRALREKAKQPSASSETASDTDSSKEQNN